MEEKSNNFDIFDDLTDIIYVVDEKESLVYGNNQFYEFYNLKNTEFKSNSISNLIDDENLNKAIREIVLSNKNNKTIIQHNFNNRIIESNIKKIDSESGSSLCIITENITKDLKPVSEEIIIRELKEKDNTFSLLFSNMNEAMAIYKAIHNKQNEIVDFEFITINNAFETSFKLKQGDVLGKKLFSVFPIDSENWVNLHKNAYNYQKTFSLIDYSTEKNKYWEIKAFPAGKEIIATMALDITERKLAEKNLHKKNTQLKTTEEKLLAYNEQLRYSCELIKESELKYKNLFNNSNDAILIIANNIIKDCNKKALSLLDAKANNIIGKTLLDISSNILSKNKSANTLFKNKISKLKPGEKLSFEWSFNSRNNKTIDTDILINCYEIGNNKFYYIIIKDLTTEKNYLEKIKENQFQLQEAQQRAKLGYWSFDIDNPKNVEWSEEMLNILEVEEPISFYDFFKLFVHNDNYVEINQRLKNFRKDPKDFDFQFKIITPDNKEKYIRKKGSVHVLRNKKICRGILQDVTEIKLKELQILQTEKRFETILENMPVLLFATDDSGTILFWNRECERISKFTATEIVGKPNAYEQVFSKIDFAHLSIKSNSGTYRNFETKIKCKDRQTAVILWSGLSKKYPIPGWHNWIVGLDITHRNQQEQEIKTQKEFLDILIDNLPLMVFVKEPPNFEYSLTNKNFRESINKEADDIIGKTDWDLDESSAEERRIYDEEVIKKGKIIQRNILSYDKQRLFNTIKVPVQQKNRNQFLLGISQDITEKYEQEKRIIFEARVNESLANASKELISPALSIKNIVKIIFKSCIELTNCETGYIAFDDPGSNNILIHYFVDSSVNNQTPTGNIVFISKNEFYESGVFGNVIEPQKASYKNKINIIPKKKIGALSPKEINNYLASPAIVNGKFMGQIVLINAPSGYTNDHMKAINSLSNVYGLAIFRKTIEWDLVKAKNKAEESDRLKSAFLANMSHEVRTPMNAIIGFTQLITKSNNLAPEKINEYTNLVNSSCDDLLLIVNDIIDISKIEAGQLILNPKKINLHDLLAEILEQILHKSKQKKKTIPIYLENNILSEFNMIIDRVRLKQILMNLLDNAVKFTKEGKIKFGYKLNKKGWIHFYVSDTGIGVSVLDQKNIFESFRQTEETINRTYGGTGLGLTISKNLVEQMHGQIGLESKVNEGSTFWFDLPLNEIKKENTESKHGNDVVNINLENKSILIVDDEKTNSKLLAEYLENTKAKLHFAYNGLEAIEKANKIKPDIIFMDIRMPEMNGIEATKQIKKNYEIPIIAQTAFAMKEDEIKYIKTGFDGYISKPIKINELFEQLKLFLLK